MTSSFEELLAAWDGEAVVTRYDGDHDTYMFIGVHSTALGLAAGGPDQGVLLEPADAERIADAGILYAPDFVINAGGALHLFGLEVLGWSAEELAGKLAGVGRTLTEIYQEADRDGGHTEAAAEAIAQRRLSTARGH